ncbi:hypothetical protein EMMF5_003346 [Cystobasidiomycetes sp. EMM_F5]
MNQKSAAPSLTSCTQPGWTGGFLIPLLKQQSISYASTSRDGSDGTIRFLFDPESDDQTPFEALPNAKTIIIIFPIYISGGSKRITDLYNRTHPKAAHVRWIQLGSTGIWKGNGPTVQPISSTFSFTDRHSPIDQSSDRARAEEELLSCDSKEGPNRIAILNLCGLWGGPRSIRRYVNRIAGSKEALAAKTSIHMIHGIDVARALLAMHQATNKVYGQRWLVTDLRVYDWWDLASKWGEGGEEGRGKPATGPQSRWVTELMQENGVQALPRTPHQLRHALTSSEFWQSIGISPTMGGMLD